MSPGRFGRPMSGTMTYKVGIEGGPRRALITRHGHESRAPGWMGLAARVALSFVDCHTGERGKDLFVMGSRGWLALTGAPGWKWVLYDRCNVRFILGVEDSLRSEGPEPRRKVLVKGDPERLGFRSAYRAILSSLLSFFSLSNKTCIFPISVRLIPLLHSSCKITGILPPFYLICIYMSIVRHWDCCVKSTGKYLRFKYNRLWKLNSITCYRLQR